MKTMNWVFCLSVVSLAGSTWLMLHKDHDDEWREYQKQFFVYEQELLGAERLAAMAGSRKKYEDRVARLTEQVKDLEDELESGSDSSLTEKFNDLSEKVNAADLAFDLQGRTVRFILARLGVAKADRDLGIRDQVAASEMKVLDKKFNDLDAEVTADELAWEESETELIRLQAELGVLTKTRNKAQDDLKKFTAEVERLTVSLDQIAPEGGLKSAKRVFMEQPIIDGFNSHIRIVQDWLPDLKISLGMATTARFDRCRTCHLGINRFGAGDVPTFPHGDVDHHAKNGHGKADSHKKTDGPKTYPHPFSSHPRPDVYLMGSSPHPQAEFGCTICHDGTGSATSFYNAQHGPNDPVQEHEWNEEYGHHHNHFWEYPMQPERLRDSTCLKCHHDVIELGVNPKYGATAPKAVKGWELIKKYGCFGCHEINGFDAGKPIGPDLRLEPTAEEKDKYANDPKLIAGKMRKVGPSLKHVGGKVSQEWIAYWTEEPKRFRPSTKMPQFFGKELTNLHDDLGKKFSSVEIAAIAKYLTKQSTSIELLKPALAPADRDAERGKSTFAKKGCLACHSHSAFPSATADFAPNLSNVHEKLAKDGNGFNWLYTWIRDPHRHHPRTKMPNLFLAPTTDPKGAVTDPAADIATFLLSAKTDTIDDTVFAESSKYDPADLIAMAKMYLKAVLTEDQIKKYFASEGTAFPLKREQIKGDETELVEIDTPEIKSISKEIELALEEEQPTAELEEKRDELIKAELKAQWKEMLLTYVGKRSVTRYGCFGCHDINGFGSARTIGTSLQDWGRKDTSRLASEHIQEYLHHYGETDGSSTSEMIDNAIKMGKVDAFSTEEEKDSMMRRAFFYDSLIHHGRAGFFFQKLRDPRSYDYEKTSTKRYDERLVMPKFPLTHEEIEAIATFVLGLVAAPPAEKYIYKPKTLDNDRNQGEILLRKYNCISCHMLDMEQIEYGVPDGELAATDLATGEFKEGHAALLQFRPPVPAYNGKTIEVDGKTLPVARLRGLVAAEPDPDDDPEDQELIFTPWESARLNRPGTDGEGVVLPSSVAIIPVPNITQRIPAQTGQFSSWLTKHLVDTGFAANSNTARQSAPPPLFMEGDKVQTGWLYRFLKDPEQIRFTPVLRMPKFNMSDEEARILASYFAAADGVQYPYQAVPQQEPGYQQAADDSYQRKYPERAAKQSYLDEGWSTMMGVSMIPGETVKGQQPGVISGQGCNKCHQVGGQVYVKTPIKPGDPPAPRGPNLSNVSQRLRPEWVHVWLLNPKRITPYTAMPINFGSHQVGNMAPLFKGTPLDQTMGVRDALMNYNLMMERKALRQSQSPAAPVAPAAE
jgi:mono/diheme cytochrome c family protein